VSVESSTDSECSSNDLIPLSAVPNLRWIPRRRRGAKLSYTCLWRWATKGVAGVVLPIFRVGGTPCTTESNLREFFADIAAAKRGDRTARPYHTPARRLREIEKARERLARDGIC
jgi:hypothetical protein